MSKTTLNTDHITYNGSRTQVTGNWEERRSGSVAHDEQVGFRDVEIDYEDSVDEGVLLESWTMVQAYNDQEARNSEIL